jgi:hypothetical protein
VPTVRIDDEVYSWLKAQAEPFEDTPNSVLRRIAKLDKTAPIQAIPNGTRNSRRSSGRRSPLATGDELLRNWHIPAAQARFHRDGTFFERPRRFPAALCDRRGYVRFETEEALEKEPNAHVGPKKVNVPAGISSLPGYTLGTDPVR